MARVTLRTVAPAKVSACQSAENDCTRLKASLTRSSMFRAAKGIMKKKDELRNASAAT